MTVKEKLACVKAEQKRNKEHFIKWKNETQNERCNEMNKPVSKYFYYMRERPPMPGALPREGLVEARDNEIFYDGEHFWGEVVYNRKLTREECDHYSLELHRTFIVNPEG